MHKSRVDYSFPVFTFPMRASGVGKPVDSDKVRGSKAGCNRNPVTASAPSTLCCEHQYWHWRMKNKHFGRKEVSDEKLNRDMRGNNRQIVTSKVFASAPATWGSIDQSIHQSINFYGITIIMPQALDDGTPSPIPNRAKSCWKGQWGWWGGGRNPRGRIAENYVRNMKGGKKNTICTGSSMGY